MKTQTDNSTSNSNPLRPVVFVYAAANVFAFLVMISSVVFTTFPAG
ncbi:hypothetical protein [Rhizobium sp. L1K21]|nr:hypothetical protein [Rhizobium sp. L1K21]MCO6185483.1 hypothetical protein [Rhizobium sp. L1K21]